MQANQKNWKIWIDTGGTFTDCLAYDPNGKYAAKEFLDDGPPLQVAVTITGDSAEIDFSGSGAQHPNNLNATPAIVNSVVVWYLEFNRLTQKQNNEKNTTNSLLINNYGCLYRPWDSNDSSFVRNQFCSFPSLGVVFFHYCLFNLEGSKRKNHYCFRFKFRSVD